MAKNTRPPLIPPPPIPPDANSGGSSNTSATSSSTNIGGAPGIITDEITYSSNTIYDKSGETSFILLNPTITIGKNVADADLAIPKDYQIKVGDTIYLTLRFSANSIIPPGITFDKLNFDNFFKFKSESDAVDLIIRQIPKDITPNSSQIDLTLEYIVDLSNLNSGEKIFNLISYRRPDDSMGIFEDILTSSKPFYLHQSILNKFQDNIANEGIADRTVGLDRDKVNFPSYLPVGLQPINPFVTRDVALWEVIRDGTDALSFNNYAAFMDYIFCGGKNPFESTFPSSPRLRNEPAYRTKLANTSANLELPFTNVDSYRALKVATEAFVMATMQVSGVLQGNIQTQYNAYLEEISSTISDPATIRILPYLALIRQKMPDLELKFHTFDEALSSYLDLGVGRLLENCYGLIAAKLQFPVFLELIWSYWHEESMMVQGISTVARRFQNIRGGLVFDPLANLEIGPLRPLNNLLWGYVQDEQNRLSVRRRAYEYNHEYGITLQGTAVQGMRVADSRSKFIEAFHTLLNLCQKFYHQYDDTTVVADAFPLMNALKEVHMILSEGAHNQFGDLPSTARIEMLMQLYILARPEFREFLPTRQMVAYPEAWMDRVAVLNQMHNWTNTNVLHYRDLAIFGEQIVLSIRWGAWSDVINRDQAANWAIFWRPQIQNYIHAYRAVTGVDLTREDGIIDALQPSVHLLRRLKEQNLKLRI